MNKAANKPTGHDDDLYFEDPTTSAAPEFYENGHHLDEDIYDFSNVNVRPSLNLDTSSNNPTDDEEEGLLSCLNSNCQLICFYRFILLFRY